MIHYLIADDNHLTRTNVKYFLQHMIESEFGPADGTVCDNVERTLKEVEHTSNLSLIVLDMDFGDGPVAGGLKILKRLNLQQRSKVVVYSGHVEKVLARTGRTLGDEICVEFSISPDRIVDLMQGPDGLWMACANVLRAIQ